jgi:hypothetical protein
MWRFLGEYTTPATKEEEEDDYNTRVYRMDEMVEATQPEFTKDPPIVEVELFFKILKALEEPMHEQIEVTLLASMTRLMAIVLKYFFSNNFTTTSSN